MLMSPLVWKLILPSIWTFWTKSCFLNVGFIFLGFCEWRSLWKRWPALTHEISSAHFAQINTVVDLPFLEFVVHEAKVLLCHVWHLAPIDQRQLTTCILSDSASCHCDSVTCTWHNCFYCIPLRLCVLHRQVSECKIIRKNVAFRIIFALYPSLSNVSNSFAVFCLTCLFQCLIKR